MLTGRAREARKLGDGLAELVAALALSISGVGLAIAIAALIFSGPLEVGLPRAATSSVLAAAIAAAVIGWRSGLVPAVAVIQDGPAIVMVALSASIARQAGAVAPVDVLVLTGCTTAVTGLLLVVGARFDLGRAARFLPTTVVGSFIAGTGWLLAKGGFDVMLDTSLGRRDVGGLFDPGVAKFWVPGLALGIGIQVLGSLRRVPPVAMSVVVLVAVGVFFVVVALGTSISSVEEAGWLLGPFPDGAGLELITPRELGAVEWGVVTANPGSVLAVVAVSVVSFLLNLSGLEVVTGQRVDHRREGRLTGLVNLVIAPLGAVAAFHGLGDTVLARQMGARTRITPIITGVVCLAVVVVGSGLIGYTPRFVAGGLLVAVGVGLLLGWLRALLDTPSTVEVLLGVVIVVLIALVGILEGIIVGLVVACLIFVVRYSRIDPIRLESTGRDTPSRVTRSASARALLADQSNRLVILQLTGYLFFGSFSRVADRARSRLTGEVEPPEFLLLDFRHVSGIDASAYALLDRLAAEAAAAGTDLLVSGVAPAMHDSVDGPDRMRFPDLDSAVAYTEQVVLDRRSEPLDSEPFASMSTELRAELTPRSVVAGEVLIAQGASDATLFLLIEGSLVVTLIDASGTRHRLRRISCGALIGEVSVLTGLERSAEVTAATDAELLELSRRDYERLRRERPELALELHDLVLAELVSRSASLSDHLSLQLR